MVAQTYTLARLAGNFPPGLNSKDPPWELKPGETPDGYGFDLDVDGGIKVGTVPSGAARVEKTITLSSVPFVWHYARLWNITGMTVSTPSNILRYGAEYYDAIYLPQGLGKEVFDEDVAPILTLVPLPPDKLAVLKTTGGYVLNNIADARGYFGRTDIMQELACPVASHAAELDGVLYVANANGVTAYKEGQSVELSRKVRGESLNAALTVNFGRHRVLVGTTFVFDAVSQQWFKYAGSGFRFTSRQMRSADWSPFAVDRLLFTIQHQSQSDTATLSYQVKYEDGIWEDEVLVHLPYVAGGFTSISESLRTNRAARRFQMRVTALAATVVLRDVWADSTAKQRDDWSA